MRQNCCVIALDNTAQERAAVLASDLGLPLVDGDASVDHPLQLGVSAQQLDLRSGGLSEKNPLKIDFTVAQYQARLKRATVNNELIAKACGLKGNTVSKVIDCTAGLGQDGYLLSYLGAEVTLLEQSPVVHCLLQDGLRRLPENWPQPKLAKTSAQSWLVNLEIPVDIIMLDPMFPERQKSALVKKGMQRFHQLIGHQSDDADDLFAAAMAVLRKGFCKRVVVKRPTNANYLGGAKPHHSHKGKAARFDVYM